MDRWLRKNIARIIDKDERKRVKAWLSNNPDLVSSSEDKNNIRKWHSFDSTERWKYRNYKRKNVTGCFKLNGEMIKGFDNHVERYFDSMDDKTKFNKEINKLSKINK